MRLPAVALPSKMTTLSGSFSLSIVGMAKNCWTMPELLTTPPPLKVNCDTTDPKLSPTVILKGLPPGLKTMLSTSTGGNTIEVAGALETPKVAMSAEPFGTVAGVQLAAVLQSPVVGLRFQVALPPKATVPKMRDKANAGKRENFISQSQQKVTAISR